jgi:hypothetical protein
MNPGPPSAANDKLLIEHADDTKARIGFGRDALRMRSHALTPIGQFLDAKCGSLPLRLDLNAFEDEAPGVSVPSDTAERR